MTKNIASKQFKKILSKDTGKYGKGIFASEDIKKGSIICIFGGKRISLNELINAVVSGKEAMNDPLQIGRKTYIDLDEFSRSFNHSCNPNSGVRKRSELIALRDIKNGEQINYDYSSTIAPTQWDMKCKCGSKNCRKIIHDIKSIPKVQLNVYKKAGAIQRYMKPLLKCIELGTYKIPIYELIALKKLGYK